MRKKVKVKEDEEEEDAPLGDWWKPGYTPPPPPKESSFTKFKSALRSINLRDRTPSWRLIKPSFLTFKCLVALFLFFIYLVTTLFSMTSNPYMLILLIPTMWILLSYVKLALEKRKKEGEKD